MTPAHRLRENPLLTARDVPPSLPELEVVSVFNAAVARVGDEVILLMRVAERPRSDIDPPPGALTVDLGGPSLVLRPLPAGYRRHEVIGMSVVDTSTGPARVVVAYIPIDLPGLDLHDPRSIRYRDPRAVRDGADDGYTDHLAQLSHLRVARSRDGIHFAVDPAPALTPDGETEEYGIEDPRATFIDGRWYVTYVSVSRRGITTSLASTTDFRTFERHGVIFLPDHKDVVLFPGRIGGTYRALTRPMPGSFGRVIGVWIASSGDLLSWGSHVPLCLPRAGYWDERRTGGSAVPFRVAEGWLELYHGVDHDTHYAIGALLLDGDDPTRVLARSERPILAPEESYERNGLFNDTVFSCGPDESEPHLWAHLQEGALAEAGDHLGRGDLVQVARESALRYLAPLIDSGFALPTVQPDGVASAVFGVERLADVTHEARFAQLSERARAVGATKPRSDRSSAATPGPRRRRS